MSYCKCPVPLSFCDTFKNPCKVSSLDLEEAADRRVHNRIYFNGITRFGYQMPFMEAVNPGCRDPNVGKPDIQDFLPKPGETYQAQQAERFHYIDVYAGLVNGINYGRVKRLVGHKRRNARSPYGPTEKFCVPITSSMDYGWFMRDRNCLEKDKWYRPVEYFPQKRSEMTIFVDEMGKTTPNFILF